MSGSERSEISLKPKGCCSTQFKSTSSRNVPSSSRTTRDQLGQASQPPPPIPPRSDPIEALLRAAELPSEQTLQSYFDSKCNCKGGCSCKGCLSHTRNLDDTYDDASQPGTSCCGSKRPEAIASSSMAAVASQRPAHGTARELPTSFEAEEDDTCNTCVACDVDMRLPTGIPAVDSLVERRRESARPSSPSGPRSPPMREFSYSPRESPSVPANSSHGSQYTTPVRSSTRPTPPPELHEFPAPALSIEHLISTTSKAGTASDRLSIEGLLSTASTPAAAATAGQLSLPPSSRHAAASPSSSDASLSASPKLNPILSASTLHGSVARLVSASTQRGSQAVDPKTSSGQEKGILLHQQCDVCLRVVEENGWGAACTVVIQ